MTNEVFFEMEREVEMFQTIQFSTKFNKEQIKDWLESKHQNQNGLNEFGDDWTENNVPDIRVHSPVVKVGQGDDNCPYDDQIQEWIDENKNKLIKVNGRGRRMVYQVGSGSFHTTHKQEDVEKWLKYIDDDIGCRGGDISGYEFERVFNLSDHDWEDDVVDDDVDNFEVTFEDSDLNYVYDQNPIKTGICPFDDRIQTFLENQELDNK